MNSTPEPSYKVAARELAELWASLQGDANHCKAGISSHVGNARLRVDTSRGEKPWEHVELEVIISRSKQGDRLTVTPAVSETFVWRMGLGLINWAVPFSKAFAYGIPWQDHQTHLGRNKQSLSSQTMSRLIQSSPAILRLFAKTCNPAEVLARVCADAKSAEQPFEYWAGDFGYDTDSIKALTTYHVCQSEGVKARKLIDGATFDRLAALANEL